MCVKVAAPLLVGGECHDSLLALIGDDHHERFHAAKSGRCPVRRLDVAIAAIGEVRPYLPGADRYAIAQAVLAAVDIHDMHEALARSEHRIGRNEMHVRPAPPPAGEVIRP